MEFKLPYGIKGNELLTIDEVESGLACDFTALKAKVKLQVELSDVNISVDS